MSVKIISKPVKICSFIIFPMCFIVKISLKSAEFFSEQISAVLIIPKFSSKRSLTIANAKSTLCAERAVPLTDFCSFHIGRSGETAANATYTDGNHLLIHWNMCKFAETFTSALSCSISIKKQKFARNDFTTQRLHRHSHLQRPSGLGAEGFGQQPPNPQKPPSRLYLPRRI